MDISNYRVMYADGNHETVAQGPCRAYSGETRSAKEMAIYYGGSIAGRTGRAVVAEAYLYGQVEETWSWPAAEKAEEPEADETPKRASAKKAEEKA